MSKIATYEGPKEEGVASGGIAVYVGKDEKREYVELPIGVPTEIPAAAEKLLTDAFGEEHKIKFEDAPKSTSTSQENAR